MYNDSKSIYAAPALESTLLLETGGLEDQNQIGSLPSTDISAAVSAGTRTFQYNRYFWNKEFFSFNYTNNAIGVAIAYYRKETSSYSFAIYPIFLPRVAMTLVQSLTSGSITDDPKAKTTLLQELVYYLNLGFTSYGVGDNYGYISQGRSFKLAPWVTAIDCKGSPYYPPLGGQIVDNPYFPIFQDGAIIPPLVWGYNGNNGQLTLGINPTFPNLSVSGDLIGFQLITLQPYMADSPLVSNPPPASVTGFTNAGLYYVTNSPTPNAYPTASYGEGAGWCSQGAFATGFGQTATYNQFEDVQANEHTYSDIYTPQERLALWQATKFPVLTLNVTTPSDFLKLCNTFKLVHNGGGSSGILVSKFITSMIPARFFSIESDALTRNQKRPVVSNNPNLSPSCMAVQMITLDNIRTWNDNTVAGLTSSAGSILFGSRKSGVDDCSIVALDPMQSLQTLDFHIKDEWGNTMQSYAQLQKADPNYQYQVLGWFDEYAVVPASWFPLPPWVVTNYEPPDVPSSNHESILLNESWWCSAFQFFGFNPSSHMSSIVGEFYRPNAPRSITLSHFGRVLGY